MKSPGKFATEHPTISLTGSYPPPLSPSPTRPREYQIFYRSARVFACDRCGVRLDRDVNASYNLVTVAVSCTETLNAWREAGGDSSHGGQCPSMMQEPNTIKAAVLDG